MAYELGVPCAGRPDSQSLQRPHVHRRERQPARRRPRPSTRRSAKCSRASGCSWSRTRSSARRRCSAAGADPRGRAGPGDPRPRGLPADRRALLLRDRHVDGRRAVRRQVSSGRRVDRRSAAEMAADSGADSLRYLPVESVARAIGFDSDQLCQACITGEYPTPCGQKLYHIAVENSRNGASGADGTESRTVEPAASRWSPSCSLILPKSRGPSWLDLPADRRCV